MAGLALALQTRAPPGHQRGGVEGHEITSGDGQPQQRAHCRAMHDTEDQAAQQPHREKARVLHARRLALQYCTPAMIG
jgi:hypothetical protein